MTVKVFLTSAYRELLKCRSKEDVKVVGQDLAPFTITLIGRLHKAELKYPWLRDIVNHMTSALRLSDKDKDFAYKKAQLKDILEGWREFLCSPDRAVPEWKNEVALVFDAAIMSCVKNAKDIEMMFPVFGEMLNWRSKYLMERIKRHSEYMEKHVKTAIKANVTDFVGMLEKYHEFAKTFTLTVDEADAERDDVDRDSCQSELMMITKDSVDKWLTFARSARQHTRPEIQQFILLVLADMLKSGNEHQARVGQEVAEFVSWPSEYDLQALMNSLLLLASGQTDADTESVHLASIVASVLGPLSSAAIRTDRAFVSPHLNIIGEIIDASLTGDLFFDLNGKDIPTFFAHILINFFNLLNREVEEAAFINTLYPRLCRCVDISEDFDPYHDMWSRMMLGVNTSGPATEALCNYIPAIVAATEKAIKRKEMDKYLTAGALLTRLAEECPLLMAKHANDYIRLTKLSLKSPELSPVALQLLRSLVQLAKISELMLTKDCVEMLLPLISNQSLAYFAMTLLSVIGNKKPQLLTPNIERIGEIAAEKSSQAPTIFNMFEKLVEADGSAAERAMVALESSVRPLLRSENPASATSVLVVMRRIGLKYPAALARRKPAVESWKGEPTLHDAALHLLDVIADRTLASVDAVVTAQGQAVQNIDSKLQVTNERVDTVDSELKQHDQRIGGVEGRQEVVEKRMDEVEEDVGELSKDVDEMNLKTMTNAPRWSPSVAQLLNQESDKDWRLFAQRLGFTSVDIRGWATQHDPCMALLSDWFSTNRTAGATHAVRTALKEMNRLDALKLVEDAVEDAEGIVADGPEEYLTPPPIFLSYQWGHQPEAKLIRRHLEMAGYPCWMDVGNMGGGDKLYEAIDKGMRGAAVMVACVTPKYAKSDNCRRELNLAVNINKPIIPLQMERMEWPPAGPMGPLLSEYLFIRLFSKTSTQTSPDLPFWPAERFLELLMQIRLHVAPDHSLVKNPYERWWEPPEEVIIVPKRDQNTMVTERKEEVEACEAAPELFLSYQWGKQSQVKKLYSKLTALGVHCWMDIYQMGGGDSLYDKIDRGIRQCKLMVACVTPKYAMSANCRKEVSLSHALKKPIIPLMLDKTDWPPAGPMSMVFTELLYIGVHKAEDEQETWTGTYTDELLGKLRQFGVLHNADLSDVSCSPDHKHQKRKPSSDKSVSLRPVSGKSSGPSPASSKLAGHKIVSDKTASPRPVSGKSTSPKPVSGKSSGPEPVSSKFAGPKIVSDETASPRPVSGKSAGTKPVSNKTAAPRPVSGKSVAPKKETSEAITRKASDVISAPTTAISAGIDLKKPGSGEIAAVMPVSNQPDASVPNGARIDNESPTKSGVAQTVDLNNTIQSNSTSVPVATSASSKPAAAVKPNNRKASADAEPQSKSKTCAFL